MDAGRVSRRGSGFLPKAKRQGRREPLVASEKGRISSIVYTVLSQKGYAKPHSEPYRIWPMTLQFRAAADAMPWPTQSPPVQFVRPEGGLAALDGPRPKADLARKYTGLGVSTAGQHRTGETVNSPVCEQAMVRRTERLPAYDDGVMRPRKRIPALRVVVFPGRGYNVLAIDLRVRRSVIG